MYYTLTPRWLAHAPRLWALKENAPSLHSAVAPLPGTIVDGAGAGRTTGGAATVGAWLGACVISVATGSSVGVSLATGPAIDLVDSAGVTSVTDAGVVGGASAPTVKMIMDAPIVTPPATMGEGSTFPLGHLRRNAQSTTRHFSISAAHQAGDTSRLDYSLRNPG